MVGWPYEVSNVGRVRRIGAAKVLAQGDCRGYRTVALLNGGRHTTKCTTVHILVCEAFHGPRPTPKHQVAHADGTRDNNAETNLRWATLAENIADKVRHGTLRFGERHPIAKLTENQVIEIRQRYKAGREAALAAGKKKAPNGLVPALAAEFGMSCGGLRSILPSGRYWKHLS